MNNKIDVLDHGHVRLVSYMQPVDSEKNWSPDLDIVRAARVSYNAEWRTGEDEGKDAKLINYLLKNHHTTPFEMMEFTFDVKAPIFVFRQWHRHRTWNYNEVSARYSQLPAEWYVPEPNQVGKQNKDNKQMRDMVSGDELFGEDVAKIINKSNERSYDEYEYLLKSGVPRELARSVLPVAIYSHMFAKVDLHNLMHFLRLRLHEHAQYEIRVYAEAILKLIEPIVPFSIKAFRKHVLNEVTPDELIE